MRDLDHEFRHWLRDMIERMRGPEPGLDEAPHPRFDDPHVQRRIANLIGDIAEKPARVRSPNRV